MAQEPLKSIKPGEAKLPPLEQLESPAFLVDLALLERNAKMLKQVADQSGVKMLLALKAYSLYASFPRLQPYLSGTCASSIHEARLGREEMGGEVHSYSPAYSEKNLIELLELSDHLIFNSPVQWTRFAGLREQYAHSVSFGLRFNPRHRETEQEIYDPSAPKSRLGTVVDQLPPGFFKQVEGLHIHNLCEKDFGALKRTWQAVEQQLGDQLLGLKWINLGGGHLIAQQGYQRQELVEFLLSLRQKYQAQIYLEPGEAWVRHTGYLVCTVLDIVYNDGAVAILDTSASCHMPDVLEMPYRPDILGAGQPGERKHTYRLAGVTCLAGDVIGDYSFDNPLKPGDRLVLDDMSHYTMVKSNTFNGVNLPAIYLYNSQNKYLQLVRKFGYEDFKGRL